MGKGDPCRVPPAAVHERGARECSGTGPCGYHRRVLWVWENSFHRETRGGGRHVAKRSSDPRVAYPEVNVQVRGLVRVVRIVAPFASRGFSIRGKIRFIYRTNQKQYTRSLVLPSWRHET